MGDAGGGGHLRCSGGLSSIYQNAHFPVRNRGNRNVNSKHSCQTPDGPYSCVYLRREGPSLPERDKTPVFHSAEGEVRYGDQVGFGQGVRNLWKPKYHEIQFWADSCREGNTKDIKLTLK